MKLLTLKANNIFSLGSINLKLADRGLLLITGYSEDEESANGAGKSSIANKALVWGLFGRTPAGSRADSVINRHSDKKNCFAEIEFVGVDGNTYRVARRRNPNKLTLYSGATDISKKSETETQELINNVLGRDFLTFTQSDFFGQGRKRSFFELTASEKRDVIEKILPMEQLSEWTKFSKFHIQKIFDDLVDLRNQQTTVSAKIDALSVQHGSMWQQELEWKTKINRMRGKVDLNVEGDLDSLRKIFEEKRNNRSLNENLSSELKSTRQNLISKFEHFAGERKKIDLNPEQCPTCDGTLDQKKKEKICLLLDNKTHNLTKEALEYGQKILEVQDKIGKESTEIYELGKKIEALAEKESYDRLVKENPYRDTLQSIDNTIKKLKEELEVLKKHDEDLNKEQEKISFWRDAFSSDLKNLFIERACPFLQEKTNHYLKALNNGQISVQFSTSKSLKSGDTKDEFNLTVKSDTGGSEYDLFSGGEQQLINFAVGMALADLATTQANGESEIMILDEPFVGLHKNNTENIFNFLTTELTKRKTTILLISNEDELKSMVPQSIHVIKKNGVTNVRN